MEKVTSQLSFSGFEKQSPIISFVLLKKFLTISSSMLETVEWACGRISCLALDLTLIPSKRDKALRGLKALSVLSDLMGPRSE